ncbi:MAG: hypothetical protein ACJ74Q_15360 [Pyrinomonadaceae bacterium]
MSELRMPETRDEVLELLTHMMRGMGLKDFYQLLLEIHRANRHGGQSADEHDHGYAEAGAHVAATLLEFGEQLSPEDDRMPWPWEAKGETYGEHIAGIGQELFWTIIAALVPQAKTGDLAPDMSHDMDLTTRRAVAQWIEFNAPAVAAKLLGRE